jgi:hypothetical protein
MPTKKKRRAQHKFLEVGRFFDFYDTIKVLQKATPTAFPVKVVFVKIVTKHPQCIGACRLVTGKRPHFLIELRKDLAEDLATHVLTHEWAHALSWGAADLETEHGPSWGVAYSHVWAGLQGE